MRRHTAREAPRPCPRGGQRAPALARQRSALPPPVARLLAAGSVVVRLSCVTHAQPTPRRAPPKHAATGRAPDGGGGGGVSAPVGGLLSGGGLAAVVGAFSKAEQIRAKLAQRQAERNEQAAARGAGTPLPEIAPRRRAPAADALAAGTVG